MRIIAKKSINPYKCSVRCGFWNGKIIDVFFYKAANERAVSANEGCYRNMDRIDKDVCFIQQSHKTNKLRHCGFSFQVKW